MIMQRINRAKINSNPTAPHTAIAIMIPVLSEPGAGGEDGGEDEDGAIDDWTVVAPSVKEEDDWTGSVEVSLG